jgi:hypothetical protein
MVAERLVWARVRALAALAAPGALGALGALAMTVTMGASVAFAQATRVDVSAGGAAADASSGSPVISADGRYVAFVSLASNLVAGDTDGSYDFFRFDRATGIMLRFDAPPREIADFPFPVAISQDGRWLLFNDAHDDWVAGDTNHATDVFQAVRPRGTTTCAPTSLSTMRRRARRHS